MQVMNTHEKRRARCTMSGERMEWNDSDARSDNGNPKRSKRLKKRKHKQMSKITTYSSLLLTCFVSPFGHSFIAMAPKGREREREEPP